MRVIVVLFVFAGLTLGVISCKSNERKVNDLIKEWVTVNSSNYRMYTHISTEIEERYDKMPIDNLSLYYNDWLVEKNNDITQRAIYVRKCKSLIDSGDKSYVRFLKSHTNEAMDLIESMNDKIIYIQEAHKDIHESPTCFVVKHKYRAQSNDILNTMGEREDVFIIDPSLTYIIAAKEHWHLDLVAEMGKEFYIKSFNLIAGNE